MEKNERFVLFNIKSIFKIYLIISVVIIFTGCDNTEAHEAFFYTDTYEIINLFTVSNTNKNDHSIAISGNIHLGVHFPFIANHLGNQILEFEQLVVTPHQIYTNTWVLGNEPPEIWILEVIAAMKIPNIILLPNDPLFPFELHFIYDIATYLGQFHAPILLQLFPEPIANGYNSVAYIDFFRNVREIFRKYAPQVAFVFTINENDVLDFAMFYPGHQFVDWVSINIHKQITEDGNLFNENTFARLDVFYYAFNRYVPIMVSIGVSHFSTLNHSYHPVAAGQAIYHFYENIIKNYPNIYAIVYKNINTILHPTIHNYKDNFAITENEIVLRYYKNAIQALNMSNINNISHSNDYSLIRSLFPAIIKNDEFFIPHNSLINDLHFSINYIETYLQNYKQEIFGEIYYPYEVLKTLGLNKNTYEDLNRIVVYF